MSDELSNQIRELQYEVRAMQFWMRELFAVNSIGRFRERIGFLEQRTDALKNMDHEQAPIGDFQVSPSAFDEYVTTVMPHILRIGEDIVSKLKDVERSL